MTIQRRAARRAAPVYGAERVPLEGGVVLAFNHFSWLDPPRSAPPARAVYFMAKSRRTASPGLGAADPRVRDVLGPPRRVRPRRRAD